MDRILTNPRMRVYITTEELNNLEYLRKLDPQILWKVSAEFTTIKRGHLRPQCEHVNWYKFSRAHYQNRPNELLEEFGVGEAKTTPARNEFSDTGEESILSLPQNEAEVAEHIYENTATKTSPKPHQGPLATYADPAMHSTQPSRKTSSKCELQLPEANYSTYLTGLVHSLDKLLVNYSYQTEGTSLATYVEALFQDEHTSCGERPYRCNVEDCEAVATRWARKDNLEAHNKKRHSFACGLPGCGRSYLRGFASQQLLDADQEEVHSTSGRNAITLESLPPQTAEPGNMGNNERIHNPEATNDDGPETLVAVHRYEFFDYSSWSRTISHPVIAWDVPKERYREGMPDFGGRFSLRRDHLNLKYVEPLNGLVEDEGVEESLVNLSMPTPVVKPPWLDCPYRFISRKLTSMSRMLMRNPFLSLLAFLSQVSFANASSEVFSEFDLQLVIPLSPSGLVTILSVALGYALSCGLISSRFLETRAQYFGLLVFLELSAYVCSLAAYDSRQGGQEIWLLSLFL